jgi:hypothetical protein
MKKSNGCGLFGGVSWAWKLLTGKQPPFVDCCHDHDQDYINQDGSWIRAEIDFHKCMRGAGQPVVGVIFTFFTLGGGWIPWYWRRLRRWIDKQKKADNEQG